MPRKAEQSSAETKEAIKHAFMDLYRKKNIDRITIAELSRAANVNRSTFYYYFEDIYDLLAQVEQDFLYTVQEILPPIITSLLNRNYEEQLTAITDFFHRYNKQYLLFLVEKPNPKITQAVKTHAQKYALSIIGLDFNELTLQQKLNIEYIANGQLGMIGWWLANGQKYSIEELSQLMFRLNMEGPFPTLFSTVKKEESV